MRNITHYYSPPKNLGAWSKCMYNWDIKINADVEEEVLLAPRLFELLAKERASQHQRPDPVVGLNELPKDVKEWWGKGLWRGWQKFYQGWREIAMLPHLHSVALQCHRRVKDWNRHHVVAWMAFVKMRFVEILGVLASVVGWFISQGVKVLGSSRQITSGHQIRLDWCSDCNGLTSPFMCRQDLGVPERI